MKHKSLLLILSLVLIGGMAFTSCSKDDDDKDNKSSSPIAGAWKTDFDETGWTSDEDPFYSQHIKYYTSGKIFADIWAFFDKGKHLLYYRMCEGLYSLSENDILVERTPYEEHSYDIIINKNQLVLSSDEEYTRMSSKDSKQFVESPKKDIVGVWLWTNDKSQNQKKYKIFHKNGVLEFLVVDLDPKTGLPFQSYIIQGKWSYDDWNLYESLEGSENYYMIYLSTDYFSHYVYGGGSFIFVRDFQRHTFDDIEDVYNNATKY